MLSLSYLFGAAAAQAYLGVFVKFGLGWRELFLVAAVTLFVLAVVTGLLLRESPRSLGLPRVCRDRETMHAALQALRRFAPGGPTCVIHGDAHLGNMYLDAQGRPGFLDWQTARRGHWAQDVTYFYVSALDPLDRRAWERDLIAGSLKFGLVSRLDRDDSGKIGKEERFLDGAFGRIRDVNVAPDGSILLLTDESDGRIIRLSRGD